MICSLSKDDKNYSVYLKLYEYLAANFNDIMKSPDASIDVNAMMKEMYADVLAKTGDHELGVRFARMVPTVLFNIAAKDIENIGNMMAKGFDPTATAKLAAVAISPETGIDEIEKVLGVKKNLLDEAKEQEEGKTKKKRGRKKKEVNDMPEGQVPKDQLALFDEEGKPIIVDVTDEVEPEFVIPGQKVFEAVAPHALKDTDQEAVSMEPGNKKFNVPDALKKLYYTVKRNIINLLDGNKGSDIDYPGVGKVYLRAQNRESLPADAVLPSTAPVVLVAVDQYGNPITFDENGKVDPKGKIAVYNLRNPFDIKGTYEKMRIPAIARSMKITKEAAKEILIKERDLVERIIDYITKNPTGTIAMDIDGGSLGVIGDSPAPYFLSSVNFGTDPLEVDYAGGNYYFTLPGLHGQPIRLEQAAVTDRPELADMFADFMTQDIYLKGVLLDNLSKKAILEKYLMFNSGILAMLKAGPKVNGEVLDISTPEAKAIAKEKIKEVFATLQPFGRPLSNREVNEKVNGPTKAKVVKSVVGARRGDILVTKDLGTGEDVYRALGYMTLNITKKGQQDNTFFKLESREDGTLTMNLIDGGYKNNYIKDNFKIDKQLNAENQLVSLNAYFTFLPLDSETSKLYAEEIKEGQEKVDEWTRIQNEQAKKAKEEFDALPVETKQAIEILDQADIDMDSKPITYNLQVSKTFENRLRKALYTREQANKIIDALLSADIKNYVPFTHRGKYGLADSIVTIMRKNVERYTRPTQPELTGGKPSTQPSTQDTTDKEADIERRRQEGTNARGTTYKAETTEKDGLTITKYSEFRPDGRQISRGGRIMTPSDFIEEYNITDQDMLDSLEGATEIKVYEVRVGKDGKSGISIQTTFPEGNAEIEIAGAELAALEGATDVIQPIVNEQGNVNIFDGNNENAHLSNFAERPFSHPDLTNGEIFNTVEGAFQAMKLFYTKEYVTEEGILTEEGIKLWNSLRNATGKEAKSIGRKIKGLDTKTWDKESGEFMKALLRASFENNPTALANLLATGTLPLTHTQDNSKWGKLFPQLLMEVRKEFQLQKLNEASAKLAEGMKGVVMPTMNSVEAKDPLDTTQPPPSSAEEERSNKSREADANSNDLRKDDDDDPLGDRVSDEWTSRIISRSKGTITAEDIEVARAWYSKHPLSKHFSFEEAFDMVNEKDPGVIATWSMNGIVLYKGSDYTELYHEAFHGFTQAFMTPAQRKALYSEVRNMTGTFKDYEGKLTPFKLANDKQVEEYLAEEFRRYMLSNGKMAIKSSPARKSFFEKLLNILEILFGNLTIGEVMADNNASSEINKVFTALRKGDMSDYSFQKANVRFNSLDSTGINAIDEESPFSSLSKKDSKLLLDTMDGFIAQFIDGANSAIKTEQGIADYIKFQIDMLTNNLSPAEMERQKVERTSIRDKEGNLKSVLTYSQSANILKTKEGRTKAYRRIEFALSSLEISLSNEYRKLKAKDANANELQTIREKLGLVMFARENFGDLTDIENNKADKDGIIRSVIGYHLAKSKDFGSKAIEMLDEDEEESTSREGVRKEGNEVSQKELATADVKYLFKTIYKMDPKTRLPIVNELGAPILMDMMEVFNKVATILENEIDVINMYNKLVKFAQQEKPTEMTMAVAQLINKLGPRGLDVNEFPHLNNRAVENLWTKFKNAMGLARIPLAAMTLERVKETGKLESRIGRGINPYASVGKGWNNEFGWNKENEFLTYDPTTGASYLNTKKVLDKYPDPDSLKTKGKYDFKKIFDFLNALGIKLSDTPEIRQALEFGSPELGTRGDFAIIRTLLSRNSSRVVKDKLNKDQWGPKYDERVTTGYSLLEMIHKNGIKITRPEDIFKQYKMQVLAGKTAEIIGGEKVEKDLYMSQIPGERKNWLELQALEGQYGSGLPSFMVTTADGNTKFEMSLNSSMSIMVSAVNTVQDDEESSAYQKLIELPYMAKFDLEQNPSAKRYLWLTNMFNIVDSNGELIPRSAEGWGKRKLGTGGIPIKLELYDISGIKSAEANGVSSASADPYTKFILDLHLATQRGLPELMRHSDKGTSYSVIPNYIISPDSKGDINIGMYMANYKFATSRDTFHAQAFENFILPNLTSEHDRVQQFKAKAKEIDNILKQIKKEKKEGQQITPTPVFDFNYLAQGQKFLMFEGILNKSTKDKLSKVEGDLTTYFDDKTNAEAQELLQDVLQETQDYFEGQYREVKAKFDEFGFVATNHLESLAVSLAEKGTYINVETDTTRLENILLNSWVYNSWINNVESTNFLYGDIAQYNHAKEEFHKRNAGIASTGTGYRTDEDWLRFVNNTLGRKFEQQYTNRQMRTYDGTMNTGVMMDKTTVSDYINDIGFNLYNQMVDKAVRANEMSTSKKSRKDIERDIKIKLFGKSNAFVEIKSIDDIANIKLNKKDKAIMSAYYNMTEADAQGWISFDSYRILMDSQGEWTPAQEKLYMAMLNGQEISGDKLATFFPPIKAQYWGTLANSALDNPLLSGVSINAFHKFQLTPIIPTLAAVSPKLQKLHEKMMDEGIDYALFESGSKIGTLTTVQFDKNGDAIRDEDGNIKSIKDNVYSQDREITDTPFTKNVIHVEYLKNQVKIEAKWKHKVTFPSQIRKLIEVDMMENGVPTDFLVGEAIEDRIEKWFALPFEEQLKASKNFTDIIEYEDAVFDLTQVKKAQLLKKAKLRVDENGDVVGNMANLVKYVKSQLSNQELADHELDFIDVDFDGNLKHDLSFSLAADKIERLLNALVIKALIRQKTNGESLIQVSGAMLERKPDEETKYGGTNGLTYYTINKDGNYINAMKVKIAMQGDFEKLLYIPGVAVFEDTVDSEGNVKIHRGNPVKQLNYNASLANLNRLIKDDNWLNQGDNRKMISMHGDRIPIQGLNSDEVAEVFEFLPKEAGNIIILPAEIVAKSGGDFDIDKLTLLFPNIGMSSTMVDGVPQYTVGLYKKLDPEEYKKRYESYKEVFAKKYLTDGFESSRDKARALELHYMLNFDVEQTGDKGRLIKGQKDILSSVIELALEEGELMTLEEFILADQEKVAQNNVLFAMNKLSMNVENYSNLVRPNGTDILDPIVDELKSTYRDYNPAISTNDEENPSKGIQASKIFEITYNLHKQMTNNLGKKALGIGAVDNTYNELFNRIGLYLTPYNREMSMMEPSDMKDVYKKAKEFYTLYPRYTELKEKSEAKKLTDAEKEEWADIKPKYYKARTEFNSVKTAFELYERQTLKLPHNQITVKDSQGNAYQEKAISLAHRYDANGEHKIGDVISQLMNGWVDIAKDPWIFYLRGNDKLGPLLLFLVQAGVPIEHAAFFISQPIITEYMNEIDKLQSVATQASQSKDPDVEKITKDRAILKAKESILEKLLGVKVEGSISKNPSKNLSQIIKRESALLDNEDQMFDLDTLKSQLDYVNDNYRVYDENGRPIKESSIIDYTDNEISDFQKAVFIHFLQIADMERAVKDIKLRTNVDTGKSGTLFEAQDKIVKLKELKRTRQDDDAKGQTRYWRLPSDVIDRLVPTVKEKGVDTGRLDETKRTSPITSFYQQPFQLAIWKDLFPLRNNAQINRFLTDLSFTAKDDAKNSTYFTDDIELISQFKSSLLPIIFQNSFLTLDVAKLKNPTGPVYYRGSEVRLEKVEALPAWGAAYANGVMYYDYASLWDQFTKKTYLSQTVSGVAPIVSADTFTSFAEYVKFVFEREYLRADYVEDTYSKMEQLRKTDEEFNNVWKSSRDVISKDKFLKEGEEILRSESKKEYNRERLRYSFEVYLRNKALKNVYNFHALFNGETSFAYDIIRFKNQPYSKELMDKLPVLKYLIADNEISRQTKTERVNLAFTESINDKETIDSFYFQLQVLSNEVALQEFMPDLAADQDKLSAKEKKEYHARELYKIAETFRKLPIVAFLQSGMNTSGRFSLTRVVDNSIVEAMLLPQVKEFMNSLETGNPDTILRSMFNAFVDANSQYNARGKNYVIPVGNDGKPTNLFEDKMFIEDKMGQKTYSPAFINGKGVVLKPFTRVNDKVQFKTLYGETPRTYDGVVTDIVWEEGKVAITVETKDDKGNALQNRFFFSGDGKLVKYITPANKVNTGVNLEETIDAGNIVVRPDMLKEVPGYLEGAKTQPGDTIQFKQEFTNKDGGKVINVYDAEVLEVDDVGYGVKEIAEMPYGMYQYTSETPMYRIKFKYSKKDGTEVIVHNIVDVLGNVRAEIKTDGTLVSRDSLNQVYVNLRSDRIKADYVVDSLATANEMVVNAMIKAGSTIDIMEPYDIKELSKVRRSVLTVLDASDMTIKRLKDLYTGEEVDIKANFDIDSTKLFLAYNEAENIGPSLAATGTSSAPVAKGAKLTIDIRDRYIAHSDFQNKAGIITRKKYRGGAAEEFFIDGVNPETGNPTVNPEAKELIDQSIDRLKRVRDDRGLSPVFSNAGYGQYMIGADDSTGKIITNEKGERIGIAVAPETFKYLSTRLLEEFGYINPNFVKEAEGVKEIARVTKQPITDEEYFDLMNKCFV